MGQQGYDLAGIRSRICNTTLVVLAMTGVPAAVASLYRVATIGWKPIMAFHIVVVAGMCTLALLRSRVPFNLRAGYIVAAAILTGLGGLFEFGLLAPAVPFVVVAPAISVVFFGTRTGIIVLIASLLSGGVIGAYTALEQRLPAFDLSIYATLPSSWLLVLACWLVIGSVLLAILVMYSNRLITALGHANRSEDELSRRVEERTAELNHEIQERRAIEFELRKAETAMIKANDSLEERIDNRTRELLAEKELFRSIVENSPVELALKSLDGTYTVINPVAMTYYEGAGHGTIREGVNSNDFWPKVVAERHAQQDRAVLAAGHVLTFEDVLPTRDGDRVIKTTKFPVRSAEGDIAGIGIVGVDITREREAEVKLRESDERFRSLFENSPNAISLKDLKMRYLLVNRQFEAQMGVSREEVIGKTVDEIFKGAFAEDGVVQDRQVIERKQAIAIEEVFERGDRTFRFSTTKFPIFDNCEKVTAIAAVHIDLTERIEGEELLRRQESEYRQLIELNPDAVVVQCDGKIVLVNQSACAMFGARSTKDLIGKDALSIVHPDFRDLIFGERQQVLRQQVTMAPTGTSHLRLDGSSFSSEFTVGPIEWNGQPATINLIRDVTERKKTEDQLRQAQRMEVVGQLTGGVAHDFNNILAIILGNLELVQTNLVCDYNCKSQLEMAIKASERGAQLTQRLLAFSRKQALRPVSVDAGKLINGMLDLLQRSLGETVGIKVNAEDALWNTEIDPGQLESALMNLAINARDAMPDGGKLTIEASNADLPNEYIDHQVIAKPGQYVLIAVSDTGTGMAPEVREHVFDPFFTTKEEGKGTGLGLSMVYGFVKQSGGYVAVDSEIGEGTAIRLYLPRYKGRKAAVERRKQANASVSAKGELILVVEDDADLRTIAVSMLQSLGYKTLEADTAKTALRVLKETSEADLLLTDVILPGGMSGRALADWAREMKPDLPVLYMSGYTEDTIVQHGRLEEGVQLLEKPFRRADIARAVRAALDRDAV